MSQGVNCRHCSDIRCTTALPPKAFYHTKDGTCSYQEFSRYSFIALYYLFQMHVVGVFSWIKNGTEQAFEVGPCHEPGPAQFDGGDDLVGDPAPDRPHRCPDKSSDLGRAQVFGAARHDCLSERGHGGVD